MNEHEKPNRRSIRLKDYNYSWDGIYFITICTHNHACLFGKIVDGQMLLNDVGKIVAAAWLNIPKHFEHIKLDEWVVMPNHCHGIISTVGARHAVPLQLIVLRSRTNLASLCLVLSQQLYVHLNQQRQRKLMSYINSLVLKYGNEIIGNMLF